LSYKSSGNNLIGKFKVKNHARNRLRERYGDLYIGNQKIKNMGKYKLNSKIIDSLKNRKKKIIEQEDGSLLVITKDFQAIVMPGFYNHVLTILPPREEGIINDECG